MKPGCYEACPLKGRALCIDEQTGIKYINAEECDGCGNCIAGCPFTPSRIKTHPEREISFKCDLCRGREEGPICVEYCNFEALSVARTEVR